MEEDPLLRRGLKVELVADGSTTAEALEVAVGSGAIVSHPAEVVFE